MSANVSGTFVSGQSANPGQISDTVIIPTNTITARLTIGAGVDGSNNVRTEKSVNNGASWSTVTTYTTVQSNVAVTVVAGEHWRLVAPLAQATKAIGYNFSVES